MADSVCHIVKLLGVDVVSLKYCGFVYARFLVLCSSTTCYEVPTNDFNAIQIFAHSQGPGMQKKC